MEETEKLNIEDWKPRTKLGLNVKNGLIHSVDYILDEGLPILEPEIVDYLLPGMQIDYINAGQAKGKFGGGKRRPVRQTQKKTEDGTTVQFSSLAVIGNMNGIVGIGLGKSKDTLPSRNKSIRSAKLGLIKIRRGCGSWACGCGQAHSIPFKVKGSCGSVEIELFPAPKGTGLVINKECAKVLKLAGITDVWSKARGHTEVKVNHIFAVFDALKKLSSVKVSPHHYETLGIVEGSSAKTGEIPIDAEVKVEAPKEAEFVEEKVAEEIKIETEEE